MTMTISLPPKDELISWDPASLAEMLAVQTNPASIAAWETKLRRSTEDELPRLNGYGRPRKADYQAYWKVPAQERKALTHAEQSNLTQTMVRAEDLGRWLETVGCTVTFEASNLTFEQRRSNAAKQWRTRFAAAKNFTPPPGCGIDQDGNIVDAVAAKLPKPKKLDRDVDLLLSELDKSGYARSCLPDGSFERIKDVLQKKHRVTPSASKRAWNAASKAGLISHNRKIGGGKRTSADPD